VPLPTVFSRRNRPRSLATVVAPVRAGRFNLTSLAGPFDKNLAERLATRLSGPAFPSWGPVLPGEVDITVSSMTDRADNVTAVSVAQPSSETPAPGAARPAPQQTQTLNASLDRSVYVIAARASLPRWLRILGPAPWFHCGVPTRRSLPPCADVLYRQQAAALAVAVLCEADQRRPDRSYLREAVRASLIRWQLSLGGDGHPAHRGLRRSPLHGAIVGHVIHLLNETAGFQTGMLLNDIERHLLWLERRARQTPWLEAATICALADGAVLVRDAGMLERARHRLDALLARQDEEGWFPECGGADIGRLSLTVDALARLYRQNGWEKVKEPLRRSLRFLIHFVHPDGSSGGCYSSCDAAFISPYGVELLAPTFTDAAALARLCRQRCAMLSPDQLYGCDDDVCAAVGASVTLASVTAPARFPEGCTYPYQQIGRVRFPRAGLTIFVTKSYHAVAAGKKGGALHVTWRNGISTLEDAGVIVVHPHGTRCGAHADVRAEKDVTDSSVTCSGILRRVGAPSSRSRRWIRRWLGWLWGRMRTPGPPPTPEHQSPRVVDYHRLAHDRYTRRITFADDWIRIHDLVRCRLPCETIVCQSPGPAPIKPFGDAGHSARPPIFVEGGRNIEITRIYRNGELVDQLADQYESEPGAAAKG